MTLCGILDCCGTTEVDLLSELNVNVADGTAKKLSYVGSAAYEALRYKHAWHHHSQWNVTTGKTVGSLQQTPPIETFAKATDPEAGHSDYFPEKLVEIMSKTTTWCDVMSLGPPDGLFTEKMREALKIISETAKDAEKPIIIRVSVVC